MFLEKLIDLLISWWKRISPFFVIHVYEHAVVLRFGRYSRSRTPGFYWKYPFIEEVIIVTTVVTTLRLPPQTITTKDNKSVVVAAIVKYSIRDPKPYVCEIWDRTDVLADVALGAIVRETRALLWDELYTNPPEQAVLREVRRQVNQYGFKIDAVTFTDLGRVNSLRLISPPTEVKA